MLKVLEDLPSEFCSPLTDIITHPIFLRSSSSVRPSCACAVLYMLFLLLQFHATFYKVQFLVYYVCRVLT